MQRAAPRSRLPSLGGPHRLGGHLVLDLLNTIEMRAEGTVDHLADAPAVARWLVESGIEGVAVDGRTVLAIRALREAVRDLVLARLAGEKGDVATLNEYLAAGAGHWAVEWKARGRRPDRRFVRSRGGPEARLAQLAESTAELLAAREFAVRRCGNPECTRFFHDPTATRRRRWCEMASCGNRMKVAAFRQRQSE